MLVNRTTVVKAHPVPLGIGGLAATAAQSPGALASSRRKKLARAWTDCNILVEIEAIYLLIGFG